MEGIKIELFIPGSLKEDPIISWMAREFKVDMKIIEASFSAESGWALLVVDGAEKEMGRLFDSLKSKGITVEMRS